MSVPDTTDRRYNRARLNLTAAASLLADARRALQDAKRSGDNAAADRARERVHDQEDVVSRARAEADLSHFLMMTSAPRRTALRRRIAEMEAAQHPDGRAIAAERASIAALDLAAAQVAYAAVSPAPTGPIASDAELRAEGAPQDLRLVDGDLVGPQGPIELPYIYAPGVQTALGRLFLRPGLHITLAVRRNDVGGYDIDRTVVER